ncbi:hypothetical protein E1B28_000164 [Marasmius oreades]|uniref:Uncharacterized protein n=1 Tax=Marasmius oreades TaxID=181124 RepID=A0A9P7V0P4_9AGAR|nr:uncharacterized protein E1B28_000164 [Marasmius oreades]KAG7098196.1 hypothetical protein E1B28_000164 [Marasmius oreades]
MPLLPETATSGLLSCLSSGDIRVYGRTCKDARGQVDAYWKRALNISRLLLPFFTDHKARDFRIIQAATGALISGSTALQFFARTRYPDSDLDVYVEHRFALELLSFLEAIGYTFVSTEQPPNKHLPDLRVIVERAASIMAGHIVAGYTPGTGIAGVYNMRKADKVIQVITATESPMDIILNFHSTVVMNAISYSHAYSLYPSATFNHSLSLVSYCGESVGRNEGAEIARKKYISRGWKMVEHDGSPWNPNSVIELNPMENIFPSSS